MSKTYIDDKGYLRFSDSDIPVHRWVAETQVVNRKLRRGEVVHHKDRNKLNNHPSNLYVCKDQAEHDYLHRKDAINHGPKASYQGFSKSKNYNKKKTIGYQQKGSGCLLSALAILFVVVVYFIV